jgi:hypothetical protein
MIVWCCIQKFPDGRMERELQMVQLSATRCSYIATLWASLVSFAPISLCVASQLVFISLSTQSGNFWIHSRLCAHYSWIILRAHVIKHSQMDENVINGVHEYVTLSPCQVSILILTRYSQPYLSHPFSIDCTNKLRTTAASDTTDAIGWHIERGCRITWHKRRAGVILGSAVRWQ